MVVVGTAGVVVVVVVVVGLPVATLFPVLVEEVAPTTVEDVTAGEV